MKTSTSKAASSNAKATSVTAELVTTAEGAAFCGVGERTFWRWAHSGRAPRPIKIGRIARFRRSEILAWIEAGCPRVDGGTAK